MSELPTSTEVAIFDLRSVVFRYPDGHEALRGIDLKIYEGDRVAVVGHNGAGKTTLIKLLNGLYKPQSGSVLFRGEPLNGTNLKAARLQVGMLFQDPDDQLFCNTVNEDVAFGPFNQGLDPMTIDGRVRSALTKVGLTDVRYKGPHFLSYGQKKRAALATLLAMQPEVLILDEPTANLDPRQEKLFVELLQSFSGTLICVSHDLPFLYSLCTRAVVLDRGQVHHDFSMHELISARAYLRDHGLDFTFRLSCCHNNQQNHHDHSGEHLHMASEPRPVSNKAPTEPAMFLIDLEDFSYRYPDGTWAIRQVKMSVQEGESLAIVGENGAGKSTLVSCIAGLLEVRGRYFFNGKPVYGKTRRELWRHIGLAFQDPADQLFCPTCLEEVAFGPRKLGLSRGEIEDRVAEALYQARLTGYENRVPHHLSAGERKRLALASVLAMHPRILILDEPTANLDPQSEELFCEVLQNLPVTKILISHDMHIVSLLCQRMVVMHQGRIIRDLPARYFFSDDKLLSDNGLDYTFKNECCREILRIQENAL